jgi:precorrin-2 dehydrogenase/sirohydrochlorin ferrochelatase
MAYFPFYIDLKGQKCLVVGGGKVALRKIQTLLQFGAEITVISILIADEIKRLAELGRLTYENRPYQRGDVDGFFLAIAATSEPAINDQVCRDAMQRKVWVDSATNPEKCSFIFPAVIQTGDLVVGLTSSGKYPALTRLLKQKIAALPILSYEGGLEKWAAWRRKIQKEVSDPRERERILRAVGTEILDHPQADPGEVMARIDGVKQNEKN